MPVSFRPAARADLLRQFEYFLEVANAELAHRFLDAVEAAALRLSEHPRIGALQDPSTPSCKVSGHGLSRNLRTSSASMSITRRTWRSCAFCTAGATS